MKTSLTFLYDNKTGNIQYIDKTRFIKEFCGSLSQKNNKIIDLQEVKKLNSSTYRDILKKYDKSFLKLSPGIQSTKLNQNIQLILLLDKTTEDFEKYCKKNNWKFGQEVEKLNNISDDIKLNLSLLKNKKKSQESPQKQGIIYSKEKVSLNDSLQKIWQYKPKETKEELKMKNKNIVKKVAVASLAALISVPNIVAPTTVQAAYNQEYESYLPLGNIISSVNQGNYTLLTDSDGEQGLVHTSQWNEYQLLLNQGSPKVTQVWIKGSASGFYGITAYQLAGQQKVTLPENAVIKVTDNYNLDHLSVLKYLGNQLGQSYLFNVNNALEKEKQKIQQENAKIAAEYSKERAKWAEMDKQVEQQAQINAEMDVYSNNYGKNHSSSLPYTLDYITNYRDSQEEISHNKVWASLDNERNDIQHWLTVHGFKSMQELKDYAYKTGVTHYGLQEQVAIQYCKYVEEGKCSTIGDYIRLKFKENSIAMWNQLEKWNPGKGDYGILPEGSKTKLICYEDEYKYNLEICKMIEANMPIIANHTHLNKEEKTKLIEQFLNSFKDIYKATYVKNIVKGYESRTELMNKLKNKWSTEYLPNIKE